MVVWVQSEIFSSPNQCTQRWWIEEWWAMCTGGRKRSWDPFEVCGHRRLCLLPPLLCWEPMGRLGLLWRPFPAGCSALGGWGGWDVSQVRPLRLPALRGALKGLAENRCRLQWYREPCSWGAELWAPQARTALGACTDRVSWRQCAFSSAVSY